MPQGLSMKSGIAVSGTRAHLMRSTDDTTTHAALYYSPSLCTIHIVWMYYILWILLATGTFPPLYSSFFGISYNYIIQLRALEVRAYCLRSGYK
jgi:hypothetical protein